MNSSRKIWIAAILIVVAAYAVYRYMGNGFSVSGFHPFANYKAKDNTINVDLSDAVYSGIEIPTVTQVAGGKFVFDFHLKNKSLGGKKFFYKIYYQDESYKYPEYVEQNEFKYENPLCTRNFYGSWGETDPGFKSTKEISWNEDVDVQDSFRIVGNPRNEEIYFGPDDRAGLNSVKIANMINYIHTREDWMQQLGLKARDNGITIEQQVYRDAVWQIDNARKTRETNNRWKRNPRTGNYKFLLVVATEKGLGILPPSIKNITQRETDGTFINPFYYFVYGEGSKSDQLSVNMAEEQLHVVASFIPSRGVYIDPFEFTQTGIDTGNFCPTCGTDSLLFRRAQFEQYYYYEDKSHILPTIPVAFNVTKDNYTREMYNENIESYSPQSIIGQPEKLIRDYVHNSRKPCETVVADTKTNSLVLTNPGNTEMPYRKENVGVRARVGFTYGKFRVCAEFPELLSADHVWNGLSNSIWLLYQDDHAWNARRDCSPGFIPKNDTRREKAQRATVVNYSEIDMDIVKSSRNWPESSYGENEKPDEDFSAANDNVAIACSNWDLACTEPKKFVVGAVPLVFENHRFELHRWDNWYQAVTSKTAENDDELFRLHKFYWYEIEWAPDHITWRVGPDKEHLRVVGYMNDQYTVIPDNQMSLIISQKFPDSDWWTPAPYDQRYIPYPKDPLEGRILAVEVE